MNDIKYDGLKAGGTMPAGFEKQPTVYRKELTDE